MDRIGGWNVNATAVGAIATASKAALANKQHVIYTIDVSFSATPAAPVRWELLDGATSPATLLAGGYVLNSRQIDFAAGICVPIGHAAAVIIGSAGAGVIGEVNLHGNTR